MFFENAPSRARRIVALGDTIVATVRTYLKAVWFADDGQGDLVCSTGFAVLTPHMNTVPRFVSLFVQGGAFTDQLTAESVGIAYPAISEGKLGALHVAFPPPAEQAAIVRYLDHADRRISRYIRAKQRLIELLEEEKQATIHRAVTRGLEPDVRLKPSGVEWLGDVPEHWEVRRIKNEFDCLNSRRIPLSSAQRGALSVREYDYYGASGVIDKVHDFIFDEDLILIAEDGANLVLRNLPLAIIARGKFWVNNHAHILRPKRGNLGFLAALLETVDYRAWVSGAAQPKLTKDRLLSIALAVPSPPEQASTIRAATDATSKQDAVLARARQEVELLGEYRTRLIADVVTGKLDVKEAAAALPEVDPAYLEDIIEIDDG